ncbi:MAG TPA: response regulator, partial [Longimicrobium sp.]|nr:response regulator [Longimicrobium sp.]
DPTILDAVRFVLEPHGIRVETLAEPGRFWETLEAAAPDLLVLDLGIPHGDGYWVVESLRGEDGLRAVPIVVYTARELDEEDRERLRLGQTEFLVKGRVTPEEFEKRVVSLLNRIAPARHTLTAQ